MTVESRDAFWWPVGAVLIGALASLAVFLFSGINRRKAVLRANLRGLLDLRAHEPNERKELLWVIDGLGDEGRWFKTRWSAAPELYGVQGIWSSIVYARADLDDDEERVLALKARIVRWLKAAEPIYELSKAFGDQPPSRMAHPWIDTQTHVETEKLLNQVRMFEPADDVQGDDLIRRVTWQTTWHEAFATLWVVRAALDRQIAGNPVLDDEDHRQLRQIDAELDRLDLEASEDPAREETRLIALLQRLDRCRRSLETLHRKVQPEAASIAERPTEVGKLALPAMINQVLARGSSASSEPDLAPPKTPTRREALRWIIWRDLGWTAGTAILTAALYLLPFYNSTWGSLSDYGTALAAGFLGKVGIQRAAMPAFHTLRLRQRQARQDAPPAALPAAPASPDLQQLAQTKTNGTHRSGVTAGPTQ